MRRRKYLSRAFTLVELLVVIGIMLVLASLLLPVLSETKAKAKQTSCLNNLKQTNLAVRTYADDFKDKVAALRPGSSCEIWPLVEGRYAGYTALGYPNKHVAYEIKLTNAEAILTAVIRGRVQPTELSKFVPAACGEVWSFVRSAGLPRPGRHVALYLDSGLVEVGAEVSERFTGNDRVHCSHLPGGRAATTTHFGPYARLADAHSEVRQWCAAQGQRLSSICWEIYGHWDQSWNADPSKIRTDIFHLLEDQKG